MHLGIDLGTSGVKVVLVDDDQRLIDQATAPLDVSRPRPLWSEQDPEEWWRATQAAMAALKARRARELGGVRGIGLSGQMHGATLLDARDRVLRPAILWNDGRSAAQCAELERREPRLQEITGNLAMPGFTAPKLLWVAEHEPEAFARVARVLLPKDYLRLRMTGAYASDMSDSAGTLWLDVAARAWSPAMLAATGLEASSMPELFEGSEATGTLRPDVAASWGVPVGAVVAGGAGDNAAGAVGVGVVEPGTAFLSLGTSGVLFVANDGFRPNPAQAVHAFCHALPGTWHQMSVILSAAACLSWIARATGGAGEAELLAEAERADRDIGQLLFLPYLSGERTPHNDPNAMGVFFGMTHDTGRADLARAVLEGVAFAFADGQAALEAAGTRIDRVSVIGGGARSKFWGRILAAALDRPLVYHMGGDVGPAFGAARLGRLAATGENPEAVCTSPPVDLTVTVDPDLAARYAPRLAAYRRLYQALRPIFGATPR
ncbi:MAG TPA: xylulokinase [Alphaproteobacteria bacterium]|nr:xylulokinase [Alphaproteobacteria bacterium]